jgi:hypothetical protein
VDVAAKSRDLLVPVIGKTRAARLIAVVEDVEKLRDVRQLRPLLRA